MDERRGLVFRTDFAENFHGDLKATMGVEVVEMSRQYSEYSKSGNEHPNKAILVTSYAVCTLRVDFVFVSSILDRFR